MSKLQKTYDFIVEARQSWNQYSLSSERQELSSTPNIYQAHYVSQSHFLIKFDMYWPMYI